MLRRISEFILDTLRQCDLLLLGLCVAASGYGLVAVYSATRYMGTDRYVLVQAAATCIGVVMYVLVSLLDLPELVKKSWKWLFLFNIFIILLLLTPFGVADNTGNKAWLKFPFLPVSIQPAEIVKLTFTLLLAYQLEWLRRERRDLKSMPSILFLGAHLLIIFGLYYIISSDMGSGLVLLFIFFVMCFIAGVAMRWFILGLMGGGIAFFLLWEEDKIPVYMKDRFRVLFDHSIDPQGVGWQQNRSILALGGGKLTGQGLLQGTQTQSEYGLPSRHTDFIFSVIGEELGMIGCIAVLVILGLIIWRCISIGRHAKRNMELLICAGMAGMLLFQVIANIGMCLFIMPVIGLTLPFFSYGGSSVVTLYMAMGVVSSIHNHSLPDWLR